MFEDGQTMLSENSFSQMRRVRRSEKNDYWVWRECDDIY
jgi:hypothetical protein